MRRLLEAGNACIAEMDWRDMALVKLCLCAMGMLLDAPSICQPRNCKKFMTTNGRMERRVRTNVCILDVGMVQ